MRDSSYVGELYCLVFPQLFETYKGRHSSPTGPPGKCTPPCSPTTDNRPTNKDGTRNFEKLGCVQSVAEGMRGRGKGAIQGLGYFAGGFFFSLPSVRRVPSTLGSGSNHGRETSFKQH